MNKFMSENCNCSERMDTLKLKVRDTELVSVLRWTNVALGFFCLHIQGIFRILEMVYLHWLLVVEFF